MEYTGEEVREAYFKKLLEPGGAFYQRFSLTVFSTNNSAAAAPPYQQGLMYLYRWPQMFMLGVWFALSLCWRWRRAITDLQNSLLLLWIKQRLLQ